MKEDPVGPVLDDSVARASPAIPDPSRPIIAARLAIRQPDAI
jgi:hypothetical protein